MEIRTGEDSYETYVSYCRKIGVVKVPYAQFGSLSNGRKVYV